MRRSGPSSSSRAPGQRFAPPEDTKPSTAEPASPSMPELPDITLYLSQLTPRIVNQPLLRLNLRSPFVLRSVDPPVAELAGKRVLELRRLGKRIVFVLEGDLYIVIHLMIAGRLRWKSVDAKAGGKLTLATFDFPHGALHLTEAGSKRRASIHLVRGPESLRDFERGGLG